MADITRISFNSQPPEGGWERKQLGSKLYEWFQLTAARRRLAAGLFGLTYLGLFQLTAARRRLGA